MFRFDVLSDYWPLFIEGAEMTVKLTLACVICGVFLGMILGMARMAQARHQPLKALLYFGVRWPVTIWVSFFRGTPLFVQIFLMYFAVLPVFVHPVDGLLVSGELARDLRSNYGAGIQSLDKGQAEAARSVGMTYWQCMRHIILPQAFRRMLPALGNNAIAILKDSSLVSAIGLTELAYAARTVAGASARYWEPYLTISAIYWVMTLALACGIHALEKHMGKGDDK